MTLKASRLALCAAGAVLLSGCQLMSSLHLAHGTPRSDKGAAAMDQYYTARGRALLQASQPGAAIEAFNFALATGEAPAPAYNGLGIAYARIGRPELAYRFFQKARMSDPANPTYAANLDRLVKSPQFTLDMAPDLARPSGTAPTAKAEQVDLAAKQDADVPHSKPGRLQRTGAHQFSLTTLPVDPKAAPPLMRRASVTRCQAGSRPKDCPANVPASAQAAKAPVADLAVVQPGSVVAPLAPAGKRKVIDMPSAPAAAAPSSTKRAPDSSSSS